MKFMSQKMGQTGLMISLCVFITACNPEEYYPTEEFIEGIDAYCAEATDANSCSALQWCQPAYNEGGETEETMVFAACVANPDFLPDGSTTGSTAGGSTAGTDGGATAGTDGGSTAGTDGGSTAGTDGGSTAGTDGGATAGTDGGSTAGGSTGGDSGVVVPPTIDEAWRSKCANLDEKYLYVKKLVSKKETKKVVKVKVCHETGNGSSHTIIIACPALKAHRQHDDYLGSCEQ